MNDTKETRMKDTTDRVEISLDWPTLELFTIEGHYDEALPMTHDGIAGFLSRRLVECLSRVAEWRSNEDQFASLTSHPEDLNAELRELSELTSVCGRALHLVNASPDAAIDWQGPLSQEWVTKVTEDAAHALECVRDLFLTWASYLPYLEYQHFFDFTNKSRHDDGLLFRILVCDAFMLARTIVLIRKLPAHLVKVQKCTSEKSQADCETEVACM